MTGIFLARNGFNVKIYERDLKREKPCAGGLPWRLIEEFGEFVEDIPQYPIKDVLFDIEGEKFEMNFSRNVGVVVERFAFDRNLRIITKNEGIEIVNKNIDLKQLKDDFIIDARGYVKSHKPAIAIKCICKKRNQKMLFVFKSKIVKTGYFWIFPISDRLVNVGVGDFTSHFKIKPIEALKWFLREMSLKTSKFTAAPICLDGKIENLVENNVIKVGESGGLVNPITGEGIYYAMKSGEIAANCIINDKVCDYEKIIKDKFSKEFKISKLVYFLSRLPAPIKRKVFKFGLNHTKSKIERGSLNLV